MTLVEKIAAYGLYHNHRFAPRYSDVYFNQCYSPVELVNSNALCRVIRNFMFEYTNIRMKVSPDGLSVVDIGTVDGKLRWKVTTSCDGHYSLLCLFFRMSPHFHIVEYTDPTYARYFVVEYIHPLK